MTTQTPDTRCLNCGKPLSALTGANNDDAPSPGDLTLCIRCGAVMKIADDLTVRGMTDAEMDEIQGDPEFMLYLAKVVHTIHLCRAQSN